MPNGGTYNGDWNDNLFNGKGIQLTPDGRKYEGKLKDGKRHGKGTYWKLNQRNKLIRQYTGMWENDKHPRLFAK